MNRRLTVLSSLGALLAISAVASAQTPRDFWTTSGKEYTDNGDKNTFGAPEAGRNLHWFGGGATADSTLFDPEVQVDAMANIGDLYYNEVTSERAAMLLSTIFDSRASVLYEMPVSGTNGIWATAADVDANGVRDLDALEVWGPDPMNDATHYSTIGDVGGVAIWEEAGVVDLPWISSFEISLAIGVPGMNIDLDALMMQGDMILFSIMPNAVFDGGEIWTYTRGGLPGSASYLFHGGHLWDTGFDVMGAFGTNNENIDALEAVDVVPEPASMTALALGAAALIRRRRAKKA